MFKVWLNRYSWGAGKQGSGYISWFRRLECISTMLDFVQIGLKMEAGDCPPLNINAMSAISVKSYLKILHSTSNNNLCCLPWRVTGVLKSIGRKSKNGFRVTICRRGKQNKHTLDPQANLKMWVIITNFGEYQGVCYYKPPYPELFFSWPSDNEN